MLPRNRESPRCETTCPSHRRPRARRQVARGGSTTGPLRTSPTAKGASGVSSVAGSGSRSEDGTVKDTCLCHIRASVAPRRVVSTPFRAILVGLALACTVEAWAAPAKQATPRLDVKSWSLANGLQVLLLEDHKAPIATVQVFYRVGSQDEHPGIRGIAHMFEHMMFKGTERVPPEAHARLLKEVGGVTNAFTTEDLTAYHDTVPPSYVGFALELEAERMRHLKLLPATVSSERDVVIEEKRLRIDNDPVGKALELFRATAFVRHPYQWTAIGTVEDLRSVTVADCQKFYDTYYQPNNAMLIIVGDVREAEARRLVDQHFGPVPRGSAPPRPEM